MASLLSMRPHGETVPRNQFHHIPELDGIRGIAALMVVFHHLLFTSVPDPERWNWFVLLASRVSHAGGNGVDLFFVLSGFLITSLLLEDRSQAAFYWNFYWKRALRIFPLYFVALLCLTLVSPWSWRYVVLSFFFMANMAQLFHVSSAGPFWTLAIEEQFYLVWPQFARRMTAASLGYLALSLAILCPVLRLVDAAFGHFNFQFTFFHCDGLALGALLACREMRRRAAGHTAHRHAAADLFPAIAALLLIAIPLLAPEAGSRYDAWRLAVELTGITLLSYCVVAGAVRHTGSAWLTVLRSRILVFFGSISYCLYLANGYIVLAYDRLFGPMQVGSMKQYVVRVACVLGATIVVCILSRYVIELPAISLRSRVLRR